MLEVVAGFVKWILTAIMAVLSIGAALIVVVGFFFYCAIVMCEEVYARKKDRNYFDNR